MLRSLCLEDTLSHAVNSTEPQFKGRMSFRTVRTDEGHSLLQMRTSSCEEGPKILLASLCHDHVESLVCYRLDYLSCCRQNVAATSQLQLLSPEEACPLLMLIGVCSRILDAEPPTASKFNLGISYPGSPEIATCLRNPHLAFQSGAAEGCPYTPDLATSWTPWRRLQAGARD